MKFNILGEFYEARCKLPFREKFTPGKLVPIDLSVAATASLQSPDHSLLAAYIQSHISAHGAKGAFGGYAEFRSFYQSSEVFKMEGRVRNVHLGIDFWLPAGTEIVAPLPGTVHSIADNNSFGDYGPTVILTHHVGNEIIHSLYGHMSRASLEHIEPGQVLGRGDTIGWLGTSAENVGWPPHLHFQLVRDLEGCQGDYPGVCHEEEIDFYLDNCPNPLVYFGKQWILRLYGDKPIEEKK